ncbi:MAG: tRNA (adenosine(37)-N6)-threonylcarbamoyltransferase complex ATPase subunit type 1 TsaE [Gammaproteobacteria bacterium]|nr:tRNA (adenosine(37)-N6)-threonylcarbamoyltransferase complex ATPase subunit type 1 TsaE [Gammaproteobacteria bacterium]
MSVWLADEAATIEFAAMLSEALPADHAGWTVLLEGELGAGKSTLARAVIRSLGHAGTVPSPTYTLVEPYELPSGNIYHIDLYRVTEAEELRYLGWNELDDGLRLVEWPDRAPTLAEHADLQITLVYEGAGRRAELTGISDRGAELAGRIEHGQQLSQKIN